MHVPVLLQEVVEGLGMASVKSFADFTVGGGGHFSALLKAFPNLERVLAVDRDPYALTKAKEKVREQGLDHLQINWLHSSFGKLTADKVKTFDRILVDLGVSSFQLDHPERGFSFQKEGPLDMRMDSSAQMNAQITAADWIASASEEEISKIFWELGEDRFSRQLAKKIAEARQKKPLLTTLDLVTACGFTFESKTRDGRHPLTKVFQAIRMHINGELDEIESLCKNLPELLNAGGRAGIITFHSLEDGLIKWRLKEKLKAITKRPLQASDDERAQNPRSRSAKLRIYEKKRDL